MADLKQLSESDFLSLLDGVAPSTNRLSAAEQTIEDLAPEIKSRLLEASQDISRRIDPTLQSTAAENLGVRPGVFLDIATGVPKATRLQLGLDENKLNQFNFLLRQYGPGKVDISNDGRFIIRDQTSPTGENVDIMVDPVGFEGGDIAQIASQTLPMLAGGLAAKVGLRIPGALTATALRRVLTGAGMMAAGTQLTGGAQDFAVRGFRGDDINLTEIAKQRSVLFATDALFGLGLAGSAKITTKAVEGILGLAQIPVGKTATTEAAKELSKRAGIKKFPLTPGQEAESKFLLRGESLLGERPGFSAAFDRIVEAQNKITDELRRVALGLPRTVPDEELANLLPKADITGQKALARLGTEALQLEGGVAKAQRAVLETGKKEVQALTGIDLTKPINIPAVGKQLRSRVVEGFSKGKEELGAEFEKLFSEPEILARTIKGKDIASAVRKVEDKLIPAAERQVATPSKTLDPAGKAASVVEETVIEPLDRFVPSKVRSFVDELKGLEGAKVSVSDLKKISTSIDNAIAEGIAIPDTNVAQLLALKDVVNDQITIALKGAKDQTLGPKLVDLKSRFAKFMQKHDRIGIRELLIKQGEKGSVGDTEIAESILGGSAKSLDNFNDFKQFFGANSPEFKAISNIAKQEILSGSINTRTGYISGDLLRANLGKDKIRKEIASELLGVNEFELNRISDALSKAEGKLDIGELLELAKSKSLTAAKIPQLISAESKRAVAFNNKLIKAAAKGTLDAEKIKPSDFVRFASKMDPDDAARVMGILSDRPELVREIKQLAIEDVWAKVQVGDLGQERVSGTLLNAALGEGTQRRVNEIIIGKETIGLLDQLVKVIKSRDFAASTFKGAGRLGGAADVQKLVSDKSGSTALQIAGRFLVGIAYSGPLRRSVTNLFTSQDRGRVLNSLIASTPFLEEMAERFGPDGAFRLLKEFRGVVEPIQRKELQIQGKIPMDESFDPRELSEEEFDEFLQNNLRQ